jgi:hypothetical protein
LGRPRLLVFTASVDRVAPTSAPAAGVIASSTSRRLVRLGPRFRAKRVSVVPIRESVGGTHFLLGSEQLEFVMAFYLSISTSIFLPSSTRVSTKRKVELDL